MGQPTIYLAFYKGHHTGDGFIRNVLYRLIDWTVRITTHGIYSHCEIAIQNDDSSNFTCYSSSQRDGGVRVKTMPLSPEKWDLIEIRQVNLFPQIINFFNRTKDEKYDYLGALGVVLRIGNSEKRWFCSEWCAHVLGLSDECHVSPNSLATFLKSGEKNEL